MVASVSPLTLADVSSRTTSEFGSLAERVERSRTSSPTAPPRHVLVREAGQWRPALLASWEHRDGAWWGRVATTDPEGALIELIVHASLLRPPEGLQ